jgi:hypothetical protein
MKRHLCKKTKNTKYDYYTKLYQCETASCFHLLSYSLI